MNWLNLIPPIWPISLLMALEYVTHRKKHGLKTIRTICSYVYLFGSALAIYDYVIYSGMSGSFNLLMSHWLIWKSFFIAFSSSAMFLVYKFFQGIYRHYTQSRQRK